MDYSRMINIGPDRFVTDPNMAAEPLGLKVDQMYRAGDFIIVATPGIGMYYILDPHDERTYLFQNVKCDISEILDNINNEEWYNQFIKTYDPTPIVSGPKEYLEPYEVHTRAYRKHPVVTLCGSSKFRDDFRRVEKELCLKGNVVLSMNLFGHTDSPEAFKPETKSMLDDIHKQKISMSDFIYVINKGGYIGESTRNEIKFAKSLGIEVHYMEENINDIT